MFQTVMRQMENGELPQTKTLSQRLEAALVKKIGVLRMPYLCRPQDTKINPPAEQLLAVAAILKDEEKIFLGLDILLTELGQKNGTSASMASTEVRRCTDGVLALLQPFPEARQLFAAVLQRLAAGECVFSGKRKV